ncbi:MAG: hypothetical protein JWQ71_1325 [Pedosphaera sp.]|nr:hypothetical protein [Pedosphaera sp.]
MGHLVEGGGCVTKVKWLLIMTNVEFRMTNRNVWGWLPDGREVYHEAVPHAGLINTKRNE